MAPVVMFIEAPLENEGWKIELCTSDILGFLFTVIQVID